MLLFPPTVPVRADKREQGLHHRGRVWEDSRGGWPAGPADLLAQGPRQLGTPGQPGGDTRVWDVHLFERHVCLTRGLVSLAGRQVS